MRKFPLIVQIYFAKVKLKTGYVIKAVNFDSYRLYNRPFGNHGKTFIMKVFGI